MELLVSYFQEVWAALTSKGAVSAPTGTTPANTSTSAEDLGSSALAEGPSAVAQEPGKYKAANLAADRVACVSSKELYFSMNQHCAQLQWFTGLQQSCRECFGAIPESVASLSGGPSTPQQDMHEAKKPNSGPDKKSLLKTEKKKAKKARQRAAKAQVAAQTAEVCQFPCLDHSSYESRACCVLKYSRVCPVV